VSKFLLERGQQLPIVRRREVREIHLDSCSFGQRQQFAPFAPGTTPSASATPPPSTWRASDAARGFPGSPVPLVPLPVSPPCRISPYVSTRARPHQRCDVTTRLPSAEAGETPYPSERSLALAVLPGTYDLAPLDSKRRIRVSVILWGLL